MKLFINILFALFALSLSCLAQAALSVPGSLDSIVAVVNEDVITALELETEVARVKDQLRLQRTPLPKDEVLRKQLLDRLILRQIQLQIAERSSIRVNDETLNQTLENIAAQNKISLAEFREVLEREGVDFNAYREDMRKEIIVSRLQRREVHNRVTVSEQEVDNFLANEALQENPNTEYHLGHILVALPEAASGEIIARARDKAENLVSKLRSGADFAQTAVAESDGQQALEGGDLGWRQASALPTLFADKVQAMAEDQVSDPIRSPSGFHIIKLLGKRINEPQHLVQQTHVRHILVRSDEAVGSEEALRRIRQLQQRLDSGEDFAQLAKANSDDTGSAVKGGDLGWMNPGDLVPPFEQAMNALPLNKLSDPVQTRFGWHLIEVLERRQHDSSAEVKRNQARETIRRRKIEPAMDTWLRRLREESFVENRLQTP